MNNNLGVRMMLESGFLPFHMVKRADDDEWVTINGTHVLLNEERTAQSGGKLKGKSFSGAKSRKKSGGSASSSASSAWKSKLQADKDKFYAEKPLQQALHLYESGLFGDPESAETSDRAYQDYKAGNTEANAKRYWDIMEANGDPEPSKPTIDKQIDVNGAYRDGGYSDYTDCRMDLIKEHTGMNDDDAKAAFNAIQRWTGHSSDQDQAVLDKFIDASPAYSGRIQRGMVLSDDEYGKFMDAVSTGVIKMNGNASWTSSPEVSARYAHRGDPSVNSVEVVCLKNRTGTPIEHLTSFGGEDEVISHSGASWSVLSVDEFEVHTGVKKTRVYVIEKGA